MKFFQTACDQPGSPEKSAGAPLVQRGNAKISEDATVELWCFPSLYEGSYMRDAETLLCVGAYLKACAGRLRGAVYMRGQEDEDEEEKAFELFKSIIGDDILESSTIIMPYSPTSPSSVDSSLLHAYPPFDPPHEILSQFINQLPIETLYHREISQPGTSLTDTTLGKHFDRLLADIEKTVSRAREHIRTRTLTAQDPTSNTSPRRSRKTTEITLTQQLVDARRKMAELEANSNQLNALGESNRALEAENEEFRAQNEYLNQAIQALRDELESMRVEASVEHVGVQTQNNLVDGGPIQTDPIVDEVVVQQQAEISSLRLEVSKLTTERDQAITQVSMLSKDLAGAKTTAADSKKTISDLEKKLSGQEKKVEALEKASDKHQQTLGAAKTETAGIQKKLKEIEEELAKSKKEVERLQAREGKLEEERRAAIKVSEDCLKIRDELKAELGTAKSQVTAVEKQAKKKVEDLQKSLNETSAQLAVISKAAEAWAMASARVEELEGIVRAERMQAESRHQEAQCETERLQSVLDAERVEWEAQRALTNEEQQRLENEMAIYETELREERDLREREVEGYILRMSELEEWGQSRWDAVGAGCLIM
ncbi:hypothetical protein FRC09_000466 [Ceratobasidium sp. 395]|nr:hypothetical protein FRC09_000466 [Ceratobasidium sp. 395]